MKRVTVVAALLARFRAPAITEPWIDEAAQLEARLAARKAERPAPRRTYRRRVML